jgi:hypothetical protein
MNFLLSTWLQAMKRKAAIRERARQGAKRGRLRRAVPRLEALEDRCLLSGGVSLTPSEASPQLVGESVTWTGATADLGAAPVYQFRVGPEHGPLRVVRDFSLTNSFTWTPMEEGTYDIQVIAKEGFNATDTESADALDVVDSRVTGTDAVITPTSNPLVALYSVPPTQPGPGPHGTVHVEFAVASDNPSWQSTNELRSVPGRSTNFLVAGLLPLTTYEMRAVFSDGTTSAPLSIMTGKLPPNLAFPTFTVQRPPGPGSDLDQGLIFHQLPSSPANVPNPLATDLQGRVVWYYDVSQSGLTHTYAGQSLAPGGTVLLLGVDRHAASPGTLDDLREIDLAGDVVRETNVDAVNAQLTALGLHPVFSFTHDVERLPNGQTAVIGLTERTVDVNGTPTEYVGNDIIVLDKNFQVSWAWDAFDHLDVNRGPVLGEVLHAGDTDQVAASTPVLPAVDWLHINAVSWSPGDGNLIVSVRHQDWVLKIDYANGEGDGHVIWRLGKGGDFAVNSTDPNPWFSHQHDAHFIDDTTLILFDNGNTRRAGDPTAHNRGQVWKIDEQTMTATLVVNVDLGNYSPMFGAAQRLSNGDYAFTSGAQGQAPKLFGQDIEVRPDGSTDYVLQLNKPEYRSFRIQTLYAGISDQLAGNGGGTNQNGISVPGPDAATPSDSARLDSGPDTGSFGFAGISPDDTNAVAALVSGAFFNQVAAPDTVLATLASGIPPAFGMPSPAPARATDSVFAAFQTDANDAGAWLFAPLSSGSLDAL